MSLATRARSGRPASLFAGCLLLSAAVAAAGPGATPNKPVPKYDLKTFFATARTLGADVSPDEKKVAYITDKSGVLNVWTAPIAGGPPSQVTRFTDSVRLVTYTPNDKYILFQRDRGGDENDHIYRIPSKGGPETDLTPGD